MAEVDNNAADMGSVYDMAGDVSSAEAPPALPARTYEASIVKAVAAISNAKGTRYADIVFSVSTDQFPPDFSDVQSNAVELHYRFLSLEPTPRARYAWRKFAEAARVSFGNTVDLNQLIGKVVRIKVKAGAPYNGEPRAEIEAIEAA